MTTKNYGLLVDVAEIKTYVSRILDAGSVFGFDIETGYDGPDADKISTMPFHPNFKVVGFSFTDDPSWARYIPIDHDNAVNAPTKATARLLWTLLQSGRGVAHNAAFELQGLGRWFRETLSDDTFFGKAVRESKGYYPIFSDTMIEAFMTQLYPPLAAGQGVGVGLKSLTRHVFGHEQADIYSLFPDLKPTQRKYLRFNSLELTPEVISYACEDSVWCLELHRKHYPMVGETLMFRAEMQLLPVLCEMEYEGLSLDWAEYDRQYVEVTDFLNKLNESIQSELSERLGEVVNVNLGSPKQVAELLYEKLGLPVQLDPKTKRPSTGEKALRDLVRKDPVLKRILQWREIKKLLSSYIEKYRNELNYASDGKAHPNHKQIGAATGRLSVDGVSYQQWPKPYEYELPDGTKFYLNYRNFLIAPKGFRIVGYDFSQVELRVLAGMANEKALLEAFNSGVDIHKATASTMMGIPLDEVTDKDRAKGKTLNFAVVYGSGADNIGSMLGISKEEAQALLDQYFETFSGLRSWMNERVLEGQNTGVVYTKFGRKFKVWEYVDAADMAEKALRSRDAETKQRYERMSRIARSKGDRMCVNAPVQGGAADYMKLGMVRAQRAIKAAGLEDKIKLVMTVHDALEFYVHESVSTQEVIDLIAPQVSFPVDGLPEIKADWHEGYKWGEVVEINLGKDKKISSYEYDKKTFESFEEALGYLEEKKAEKTAANAPVEEKFEEVEGNSLELSISMPDLPVASEWAEFKKWLTERPGPFPVTVNFPQGSKTLEETALIFGSDIGTVKSILSGAEVELRNVVEN